MISMDDYASFTRHGGDGIKRKKGTGPTQAQMLKKNIKGSRFKCCYCGISLDDSNYTRDHLIPLSRGGTNKKTNIRPCCQSCNNEKGNLMPHSYLEWLILNGAEKFKIKRTRWIFEKMGVI